MDDTLGRRRRDSCICVDKSLTGIKSDSRKISEMWALYCIKEIRV